MHFAEFTNYLAIISSNILLAPSAFVLFFCKRICNVVCVFFDHCFKVFVRVHSNTCVLVSVNSFSPLTYIFLDFDVFVVFFF